MWTFFTSWSSSGSVCCLVPGGQRALGSSEPVWWKQLVLETLRLNQLSQKLCRAAALVRFLCGVRHQDDAVRITQKHDSLINYDTMSLGVTMRRNVCFSPWKSSRPAVTSRPALCGSEPPARPRCPAVSEREREDKNIETFISRPVTVLHKHKTNQKVKERLSRRRLFWRIVLMN